MIRAKEKGAWGYVGSCPVTYWYEDYYFVVGATAVYDKMPNVTQTETGVYEMIWEDDVYNALSAIPFVGNLAVTSARSNAEYENTNGIETLYYWEAYHAIGDGTVMPFRTNPTPLDKDKSLFHFPASAFLRSTLRNRCKSILSSL